MVIFYLKIYRFIEIIVSKLDQIAFTLVFFMPDHLYDDVHEKTVLKLNNTNERIYENVPTFNAAHREYENLNNVRNQANRLRQVSSCFCF